MGIIDFRDPDGRCKGIREAGLAESYWWRCNYLLEGEVDPRPVEAAWEIPLVSNPVGNWGEGESFRILHD